MCVIPNGIVKRRRDVVTVGIRRSMAKPCKVCGGPIEFKKLADGRFMPLDPDGSAHRHRQPEQASDPQRTTEALTPEMDRAVRKMVREELREIMSKI